jgi:hypothetical protein
MKKLILSVALAAFAFAVQAGGDKTCSDKDSPCCGGAKETMQTKAEKSGCSDCAMAKQTKDSKIAKKQQYSGRHALLSPKAAADAVK